MKTFRRSSSRVGRSSRCPKSSRAGWQLLELSMVIAVMGMICVAGTRVIFALMAIENRSGEALHNADVLERLGRQWRSDLHEARQADISNEGQMLSLVFEDGKQVTYKTNDGRLVREEPIPKRREPATETYTATARKWRFEKDDKAGLVSIVRESAPTLLVGVGSDASPSRVDRIEGAIGTLTTRSQSPVPGASP